MDAVMFPGQGSQKAGMGTPWVSSPAWAVVGTIGQLLGRDIGALLLDADAETLQRTSNAQVASFALGAVILEAARAAGLTFGVTLGHSLGEYTALLAAGVLSLEDTTRLVGERAAAMQDAADAAPGTMAAVLGLDETAVAESCAASTEVWMANDNAPGQIVVAGSHDGVAGAAEAARSRGGKVMALSVGGAFHTPLMASAQGRLDEAISAAPFAAPSGVVVMNVDSAPHEVAAGIGPALSRQLTSPVRWRESLLSLRGLGVTRVVELGPGAVLSGMLKRTDPDLERASIAAPTDLEG